MPGPINNRNVSGPATPQTNAAGGQPQVEKADSSQQPQQPQQTGQQTGANQTQQTENQARGAKDHAAAKAIDGQLQAQARGIAPPPTKEQQIRYIASQAEKTGLDKTEITKLSNRLNGLSAQDFKTECAFLNTQVLGTKNADRALRTYNELKSMQDQNPDRLTNDHVRTLTRGVAERRGIGTGWEGVIGKEGAINAAKTLISMPQKDYDEMNKLLDQAGKGKDNQQVPGSSPQMEKALILKAAAARTGEFSNPGTPPPMETIAQYAKDIRGSQREILAQQSTATDPYGGNKALQQRWNDSCGPTTAQAMKAEIDPIYARKLHQEFIHGTSSSGDIASEQQQVLGSHGGIAVSRGQPGGAGTKLDQVLNTTCQRYTGVKYKAISVGTTEQSRNKALDDAAEKLKKGIDVPIRAGWSGGGGHFMILTDVRGEGKSQLFLLTDPWEGKTVWVRRDDLASGKTKFPAGTGALTHTY